MTKKPFVHPLRDSLTPADLRLRPLLGAFRTSGAVPFGLFGVVAHFWFVSIHPFDDGNGRISRAIADMALSQADNS